MQNKVFLLLVFITLCFILISTGLTVYWSAVLFSCFLFVLYSKKLEWNLVSFYRLDFIGWFLFLFSQFVASLFTKSMPASFEEMSLLIFAFLSYWFFVLLPKKLLTLDHFLFLFIHTVLILIVLSIKNLETATTSYVSYMNYYFGHNHISVLLLLALPVTYYKALVNKQKYYLFMSGLFFVALLLSFSRVAILIGIFQLLFLSFKFEKIVNLKSVAVVVSISFLLLFTTSFSKVMLFDICSEPFKLYKQVCKDITVEGRFLYWDQAIKGFNESQLVGNGPGTFFIINKNHKQFLHLNTAYAHNAYLMKLSESGLFGLFAYTALLLIFLNYFVALAKNNIKYKYLIVSLLSIYIAVFFDFDMSISSFFTVFMIFVALVVRENNFFNKKNSTYFKYLYIALLFMLIAVVISFYFDLFFSKDNKYQKNLFLFNSIKEIYFKNNSYQTLQPFFINDHSFYNYFYQNGSFDTEIQKELFFKVRELEPLSIMYIHDYNLYASLGMESKYEQELFSAFEKITEYEQYTGEFYYDLRKKLSSLFFEYYHSSTDTLSFINLIQDVYPWDLYKINFLSQEIKKDDSCKITEALISNIGEPLGNQRETVASIYLDCLFRCEYLSSSQCDNSELIENKYYEYTNRDSRFLVSDTVTMVKNIDYSLFSDLDYFNQMVLINNFIKMLEKDTEVQLTLHQQEFFAKKFVDAAERIVASYPTQARHLYMIASERNSSILEK